MVALPVILGIGAITGILAYFLFIQVTPGHTIFTPSMFFQHLPPPLIPSEPISHNGDIATAPFGSSVNLSSANAIVK
jgi:hypothetical protein